MEATQQELYKLFISISGSITTVEEDFIRTKIFKLDIKFIEFKKIASEFIYILGDLGLSRISQKHSSSLRTLDFEQFIEVLSGSFSFAKIDRFKDKILQAMFKKISVNGKITFSEFLHGWVRKYLCEW